MHIPFIPVKEYQFTKKKAIKILFATKFHFSGTPIPSIIKGSLEVENTSIFFKKTVNDGTEGASPFAVDDADLINALAAALSKVFRHKVLHITGVKCVQVQHTIDRYLDRVVFRHYWLIIMGIGHQGQKRKGDGSIFQN